MRRNKEGIKTLAILVLSVSAVFLALASGLFEGQIPGGGQAVSDWGFASTPGDMIPAARPTAAMATLTSDGQQGHQMGAGLLALYELFSSDLGEALGSSGPPVRVTREAWEAALSAPGVLFRYDLALPGAVLARWLGTEIGSADGLMQDIYLSAGAEAVHLYFMGPDRIPYRSETAASPDALRGSLDRLGPNGARYGFRDPVYRGPDPDTILLPAYDEIPLIYGHNAIGAIYGQMELFLSHLGLNPALVRYIDEAGGRTIVEDGTTLRLNENGLITFLCRDDSPRLTVISDGLPDLAESIEAARRIVWGLGFAAETAELFLTDWAYADGTFTLQFRYYMGGLPIWTAYPAATVVISGRYIRDISFLARSFYRSGRYGAVIPEIQAAAAAGRARLQLSYALPGDDPSLGREPAEFLPRWLLIWGAAHG